MLRVYLRVLYQVLDIGLNGERVGRVFCVRSSRSVVSETPKLNQTFLGRSRSGFCSREIEVGIGKGVIKIEIRLRPGSVLDELQGVPQVVNRFAQQINTVLDRYPINELVEKAYASPRNGAVMAEEPASVS